MSKGKSADVTLWHLKRVMKYDNAVGAAIVQVEDSTAALMPDTAEEACFWHIVFGKAIMDHFGISYPLFKVLCQEAEYELSKSDARKKWLEEQ